MSVATSIGASLAGAGPWSLALGTLAGALVNERDIGRGLFTPDVSLPDRLPVLDEHVFFSALPQAISTRAEMMARYDDGDLDGLTRALERIHVTGGTNGIRVDALRAHRPFTPSWVGRAEDQAYLLSTLDGTGARLAYAHAAGLIMRHDKEAFAAQSMAAAKISKLIGDDVRILVFSAYVDALTRRGLDGPAVRHLLDPFSGGFVSATPRTVVLIRLALRTLRLFIAGQTSEAREYATGGTSRVGDTLDAEGDSDVVAGRLATERDAWGAYYEALDVIESGAPRLRAAAARVIDACRVPSPTTR